MANEMSSRERYMAAFRHEEADRVPIFIDGMPNAFLSEKVRWYNQLERAQVMLELGCDPMINIWLPTAVPSDEVEIRTWREKKDGKIYLGKEFSTPKGNLRQVVEETPDWVGVGHIYWVQNTLSSGEKVNFGMDVYDDWCISRRTEPWVKGREDLEKLKYILKMPTKWQLDEWRHDTQRAMEYAKKYDLLTCVRRTIVSDASQWFCDIEWFMYQLYDDPEFVEEFLSIFEEIAAWQTQLGLEQSPDIFQRRGWYDTPDFWGGAHFDKHIFTSMNNEAKNVHQVDALYAYLLPEGWGPYLDKFKKLDVDIFWGLDPYRNKATLNEIKQSIGNTKSILGGVSSEEDIIIGTPQNLRESVRHAVETLAPGGGFVLGPSVGLHRDSTWDMLKVFIDEAHEVGSYK